MSLNISSALPSMPDTSTLPSVGEVGEIVGDVVVSAIDTAGEAATVVVDTARRRPKVVLTVAAAAIIGLLAMMLVRRRRHPQRSMSDAEHMRHVAAA
jgi:hypothetical protein